MEYVYYFMMFAVIGWLIETVYRSVENRRLVKPGFLKGPYLPIYGFGALLILAGHTWLASYSLPLRAVFYFLVLSGLELGTGFALEKIFHTRLWDYSNQRFHIRGHACLRFSIYWTLLALALDLSLDFFIPHALAALSQLGTAAEIGLKTAAAVMALDFFSRIIRRPASGFSDSGAEEALRVEFIQTAAPLLKEPQVRRLGECNHHFGKTRLDHVLDVAWLAFMVSKRFPLDHDAVVRGALLHDLFYYDWLREGPSWHGVRHPRIALENARTVTTLSGKEEDIIKKHMWPLTVVLPKYAEAWIVCFSDIYCSWRDYLVPLVLALAGKRKAYRRKAAAAFPSYAVVQDYLPEEPSRVDNVENKAPCRLKRRLNILLIDAQTRKAPFTVFRTLTLPRLAGATPLRHNVRIMDGRVEKIVIPRSGVDLVGLTFSCNNAPLAYKLAEEARGLGIPTVAGGPHATALPDEALKHVDTVLTGEAEGGAWERLLDDFEHGVLEKKYKNAAPTDISNLSPPRLDLLPAWPYLPVYPVEATRGCPNGCAFCFNRYIHPMYRKRPVDQVVADVERADRSNIFFMDDNLTVDAVYAKELFKALKPLKKRLYFQMQLSAAEDDELVRLAAEAGCRGVFVGLESINAASLDSVAKSFNQVERYKEEISILDLHGIFVVGGLIFGLDGDGVDAFQQTISFLNNSAICSVAVNLVIPYPGTDFYNQVEDEGRLLDHNYENYTGYRLVVRPKGLYPQELEREYDNFIKEFYSMKNVLSRFRRQERPLRQLPLYTVTNLAFSIPRHAKSRDVWS